MAKKGGVTKQDLKTWEFFRLGGMKIPAGFENKAAAATKQLLQSRLGAAGSATLKEGAKLFAGLEGEPALDAPANKKTLDGLLNWHKKIAGKKLAFPKVPGGIGGFFPGRISGTVTAPFDFADSIPTQLAGNAAQLSVSASVNGQISGSAVTSAQLGFGGGSEYARVGIFFHPMTQGTLTIWSAPTYSFEWSTNSLDSSFVDSSGGVALTVYGMNDLGQILSTAGVNYELWEELATGEIHFDFGFNVTKSMSVSLPVTSAQIYICFVEVYAHVAGIGWPGSLATAMASATVPSISYQFDPLPLVLE